VTVICGSCGTEVEGDALFCPACGQPISAAAPDLPPAPDWPEQPPRPAAPRGDATTEPAEEPGSPGPAAPDARPPAGDEVAAATEPAEPTTAAALPGEAVDLVEPGTGSGMQPGAGPGTEPHGASRDAISTAPQAVPPWRRGAVLRGGPGDAAPAPPGGTEASPGAEPLPGSPPPRPHALAGAPATLSGWLIGGGAAVGVLSLFLPWIGGGGSYVNRWGLAYGINLLVLVALVAVAAIVFAADTIPAFPHRNLAILGAAFIGVGIGLDRGTQSFAQVGAVIFLLAMLAAAAGALLVELEMDRPLRPGGGPQA
jgi:hypothetical protein